MMFVSVLSNDKRELLLSSVPCSCLSLRRRRLDLSLAGVVGRGETSEGIGFLFLCNELTRSVA